MIRACAALPLITAVAVAASLSCTPVAVHSQWLTNSELASTQEAEQEFPDAPAVALIRSRQFKFVFGAGKSWTQLRSHEAWEIRNEAGRALAEVRIPLPGSTQLVELRARTISPDGKVVELTQDQMVEEKAKAENEDDAFSVHIFRFPDVQIGSVLEYRYVLQYPGNLQEFEEQVAPDMPVHRYEFEVKVPGRLRVDFTGYNLPTQVKREEGIDYTRLALTLDHVDHAHSEWSDPHWTINRPWWSFRVRTDPHFTWAQNVALWAKWVDSDADMYAGFDAKLPPDDCTDADKRCRLRAALHWLHEKTQPTGFGSWEDVRPMKEVLEGVTATGWEQAILLRRVLVDARVQAELAPTTRVLSRLVDPSSQNMDQQNHALVYVPSQAGLERPLWIDPICTHCALGQIPRWVDGVDALPLISYSDPHAQVNWLRVTGVPTHRREDRHVFTVNVDASGDAEVSYDDRALGDTTLFEATRQRKLTAEERKSELEHELQSRVSSAKLVSFEQKRCDETKAKCEQSSKFTVANFATLDGQRLLIPLTLLDSFSQDTLSESREADVHFAYDYLEEETVQVKLPGGFRVENLPALTKKETSGLAVTTTFEPTSDGFTVHRQFEWTRAVHPVSEWPGLREVLQAYQSPRSLLISASHTPAPTPR